MNRLFLITTYLLFMSSVSKGDLIFTDWQTVDTTGETATGQFHGASVTFNGTDLFTGTTDGTSTRFAFSLFTPQIAMSDDVGFIGGIGTASSYTLNFSSPITDPVIHLGSLASTLTFSSPQAFTLSKISGDATFNVSGNTVVGALLNQPYPNDASGTVQVSGVISQLDFTALKLNLTGSPDGVILQVGAVPEPSAFACMGLVGMMAVGLRRLNRRRQPA